MFVGLNVEFEFYRGSDRTDWRVSDVKRQRGHYVRRLFSKDVIGLNEFQD